MAKLKATIWQRPWMCVPASAGTSSVLFPSLRAGAPAARAVRSRPLRDRATASITSLRLALIGSEGAARPNGRPQVPGAKRRNSTEDEGAEAPSHSGTRKHSVGLQPQPPMHQHRRAQGHDQPEAEPVGMAVEPHAQGGRVDVGGSGEAGDDA
jgi:hypothetical protein